MNAETTRMIADLLLPPAGPLLLIALGLLIWLLRMRKLAAFAIFVGTLALYAFSTPYISRMLLDPLQYKYEVLKDIPSTMQAIVVLSNGRLPVAREYSSLDTVNAGTWQRLRYTAKLAKETGLPIVVAGGLSHGKQQSEAELMQHALEVDLDSKVTWVEGKSSNTLENAKFVKLILEENSITEFLLVTHAYHMPRAMWCFQNEGLSPTPAPTVFYKRDTKNVREKEYLPKAHALLKTRVALHEYFGKFWYKYFE